MGPLPRISREQRGHGGDRQGPGGPPQLHERFSNSLGAQTTLKIVDWVCFALSVREREGKRSVRTLIDPGRLIRLYPKG
jgi:hypothetical protein